MKLRLAPLFAACTLAFATCLASLASARTPLATNIAGVPARRLAHLTRGVNLAGWFNYIWRGDPHTGRHLRHFIGPRDLQLLHRLGLNCVRLPIDPLDVFNFSPTHRPHLPRRRVADLIAALSLANKNHLAVMVDIHPDRQFTRDLKTSATARKHFVQFWKRLSAALKGTNPAMVFFELLNEPNLNPPTWYPLEINLIRTIQRSAPGFTIVAPAARWDNPKDILRMQPWPVQNVIYTFHFYTPHLLTQQGANWGYRGWMDISRLPFPSNPQVVGAAIKLATGKLGVSEVMQYGRRRWTPAKLADIIARVAAWRNIHRVPVLCGEFGVLRTVSLPGACSHWLTAVRTALEAHRIGWLLWDYQSAGYGLCSRKYGHIQPDAAWVKALGLRSLQ